MQESHTRSAGPLRQLLYRSHVSRSWHEDELRALQSAAATNNTSAGITGLLLYCRGVFIQLIEGPTTHIEDLFDRIKADPRHQDIVVLYDTYVYQRALSQWTMGVLDMGQAIDSGTLDSDSVSELLETCLHSPCIDGELRETVTKDLRAVAGG